MENRAHKAIGYTTLVPGFAPPTHHKATWRTPCVLQQIQLTTRIRNCVFSAGVRQLASISLHPTSTCRLCSAPLHMLVTTISAHRIQLFCISLDVYRCSHADQLIDRALCLTITEFSFMDRYAWHDFRQTKPFLERYAWHDFCAADHFLERYAWHDFWV